MGSPRIVSVETEILADPANPQLLVHVTDETGRTGTGESWWGTYQPQAEPGAPVRPIASLIDNLLGPACIGHPSANIADLWDRLHRLSYQYGPDGIVSCAIGGIDIAMWDLAGRRASLPTAELLGQRHHSAVPAYASLHWLGDPARAVDDANRAVEAGFRGLKLHEAEAHIVSAVRAAIGPDVALMLDVSARLNETETIELAAACSADNLTWIEEPIFPQQDHTTLARIRKIIDTPLAAGENEFGISGFRRLVSSGAVNVLQPDPAKCGGLTPSLAVAELAASHQLAICPHNFSLGPSLGATIHLAMVAETARWIEVPFLPDGQRFPGPKTMPTLDDRGMIRFPDRPGLAWS